jgi:hypothetical protein
MFGNFPFFEQMHLMNLKLIQNFLIWVQKKNVPKKVPNKKTLTKTAISKFA